MAIVGAESVNLGCGEVNGDGAVARLSGVDGTCLWSTALGIAPTALAVDAKGDILVGGVADSPTDLPCGPPLPPPAMAYGLVTKLSGADGSCAWTQSFLGSGYGLGLTTDAASNVYVAGSLTGPMPFAGGTLTPVSQFDALLLKYDGAGNELWGRNWAAATGGDEPAPPSVAVTPDQRVWIAGAFTGTFTFGTQTFGPTPSGPTPAPHEVFVAGLTADGAPVVATAFTTTSGSRGLGKPAIAVSHGGNLLVAGSYGGDITVGDMAFTTGGTILAELDATAALSPLWVRNFMDAGSIQDLAVDRCGDILLTGDLFGMPDFGCGLPKPGPESLFIVRLSP